ncbi:MAG TPA: carbohydrate ABC transporter permease [Bacilli bacterium]
MNLNKVLTGADPISFVKLTKRLMFAIRYLVLIVGTVTFLIPLIWTISGSLKDSGEIFTVPIKWIPTVWKWENYVTLLDRFPVFIYVTNTLTIVCFVLVGLLCSTIFVAYGFARFRHRLNNILFIAVLAVLMIPEQVLLIPQFLMYKEFHWINTYLPLIVPSFFAAGFNGAYAIFLIRQFILSLPRELDESATMDGCSSFGILIRIITPLCKPILITIAILTIAYQWNDFLNPLIYLNDPEKFTLQIGIYSLNGGKFGVTDFGMLFAATILALIPNVIIFALGQKYFMNGIKITGAIKG